MSIAWRRFRLLKGSRLSWAEDLAAARSNLSRAQERFGCYPNCTVIVNGFEFDMGPSDRESILECKLPDELLRDILDRKMHWNNAEIGCLIRFNRVGEYMPDVHTLMSFFHLPRA